MRLSIWPLAPQPWEEIVTTTLHADRTGWDGVYVADHFMSDGEAFGPAEQPTFEALAALAALGALTERLRVGPLVLGNTYRHPAVLANWAATLDVITGGRVVLGLGAGWQRNEHEQYGIELPPPGQRLDRFEEACTVISSLLSEPTTTLDGRYYRLTDALCEPKPVQSPLPLLVGGKGDRMMGVVARHAQEWNMWGLPELIAARSSVLERRCAAIDRDPATIRRSTQALVMVTDDRAAASSFIDAVAPRAAIAGPPEHFAEVVAQWEAVGVDEVIVPDVALATGAQRLEQLDALRAAVAA
jgi:alkanesulfonate monooxygenase SsuD/methylene tetrahydromethanopterin reductase-like flavin-dependent oxidoreductase (luciferase family)